jgi:hypothetical protein
LISFASSPYGTEIRLSYNTLLSLKVGTLRQEKAYAALSIGSKVLVLLNLPVCGWASGTN